MHEKLEHWFWKVKRIVVADSKPLTCCELMLSNVLRAAPERNKFHIQSDMFFWLQRKKETAQSQRISPWESRREDDVRTLPTKSYCFRCMWQNNRFTYKTFKTAVKLWALQMPSSCSSRPHSRLHVFVYFTHYVYTFSFERRHLAKPFKSHYSFVLQLILESHWIFMILWVDHFFSGCLPVRQSWTGQEIRKRRQGKTQGNECPFGLGSFLSKC